MAVTATSTVRDICQAALRKIGVVAMDQAAEDYEAETARSVLNVMLKGWQNVGFRVFTQAAQTITLTTAASYTMSPVRPMSIETARLKRSGIEIPMIQMTRQEYDELPVKTTTGIPTQFYYNRQRENALFYVWPVLAAANGETVEITYQREIEDVSSLNDTIDMPVEWYEAVIYNLADRLLDDFSVMDGGRITGRAQVLLAEAQGYDAEGSVWFGGYGDA